VSRAGWGVAWLGATLGKRVYVYTPESCRDDFFRLMAELHGAVVVPLRGNLTRVNYNIAKADVAKRGGAMLPIYLRLRETVEEVERVASDVLSRYDVRTVVVPVGSGTIVSGVARAVDAKVEVHGVTHSSSPLGERLRYIGQSVGRRGLVRLHRYGYTYGDVCYAYTPFPSDIYYDKWAWQWLVENVRHLRDPILFWNVGGEWHAELGMAPPLRGDGVTPLEEVVRWVEGRRALLKVPT